MAQLRYHIKLKKGGKRNVVNVVENMNLMIISQFLCKGKLPNKFILYNKYLTNANTPSSNFGFRNYNLKNFLLDQF